MRHQDETEPSSIHQPGFHQATDPMLDLEQQLLVTSGVAWYDTTEGRLKIRNENNDGWIRPGET